MLGSHWGEGRQRPWTRVEGNGHWRGGERRGEAGYITRVIFLALTPRHMLDDRCRYGWAILCQSVRQGGPGRVLEDHFGRFQDLYFFVFVARKKNVLLDRIAGGLEILSFVPFDKVSERAEMWVVGWCEDDRRRAGGGVGSS